MEKRTIKNTGEEYLTWLQVERRFAQSSIVSYRSRLKCFVRDVGDIPIDKFTMEHIFRLKQILHQRENSEVFIGVCLACIKGLLKYHRDRYSAPLQINPDLITLPTRPRREVIYLSVEEVNRFRNAIDTKPIYGLRFRTLIEVLLATGMRISEALSLQINSIDFLQKEARVIGKGNKERVVFFTDEALEWVRKYIDRKSVMGDKNEALFTTTFKRTKNGTKWETRKLRNQDINRVYKRVCLKAGLNKKISNHTLRHTFATTLASNGAPILQISKLLSHERYDTTCRYYLGIVSKEKAKEAHQQYLRY
jgi:integrase/recombinase XerD